MSWPPATDMTVGSCHCGTSADSLWICGAVWWDLCSMNIVFCLGTSYLLHVPHSAHFTQYGDYAGRFIHVFFVIKVHIMPLPFQWFSLWKEEWRHFHHWQAAGWCRSWCFATSEEAKTPQGRPGQPEVFSESEGPPRCQSADETVSWKSHSVLQVQWGDRPAE